MTDTDDDLAGIREQIWDLTGISPGQVPEFGVVAVSYIDRDGVQRFSWRIVSSTEDVELEPVIELLNQLIASVTAHTEALPLDPFES